MLVGTSARLFRHRHTAQKQQLKLTGARCCDTGYSGADSGSSDHSSFDSGHSHASDHSSSSRGSSSHSDHSSSNLSGGGHDDNHHSSTGSKHDHEDSKHGHTDSKNDSKKKSSKESDSNDSFLSDSALDIVSMFDTTETDNTAVEYRPSSGTYSKPPQPTGIRNFDQPTNPDFWAYKPVWCQPWSIISTGIAFVAGARWITGGSAIATVVAAVPILAWWYVFLILVPGDFRKYADK